MRQTRQPLTGMTPANIPAGASRLAITVFRLARMLKSDITHVVSREPGVGLVTWRIFMGLSLAPEATQKELINFSRMEQAQISRALKELEARGQIASRPSQEDKRARVFTLTDEGRKQYNDLLPRMTDMAGAIDAALSPEEQEQFLDMCARIATAADQASNNT